MYRYHLAHVCNNFKYNYFFKTIWVILYFAPLGRKKVGCPTDSGMVACLKKTDAKTVTLAGNVNFSTTPSRKKIQSACLAL